jgi:STE24 endopeptidase
MTRIARTLSVTLVAFLACLTAAGAVALPDEAGATPSPEESSGATESSSVHGEKLTAEEVKARLSDPAFLERARAYTRGNYWLLLTDSVLNFALLAFLAFTGASAAAWRWIETRTGGGARAKFLYIAGFIVFVSLISLPLDYYDNFVREHAYGFSTQTSAGWFYDRFKALLITIPLAALFVIPVYAFIRRFPRTWWMVGSAFGVAFAILIVAVAPVFIDPIFNKFTPLADQDLKKQILDLAHRNGIEADDVFEMDASSRSVHDNAYVTGLLGTQRIVLYDTLLNAYTPGEITFVMGHEMGHYVLNHIWKGLALAVVLIVSGFYVVYRTVGWAIDRWGSRTGLRAPGEIATLPLMLLVLSVFLFVTVPIQSGYSRSLESAADEFGFRAIDSPAAAPDAFRRMATRNLSDLDPPAFIEWFLYSHPAMGRRIRSAEAYVATHGSRG